MSYLMQLLPGSDLLYAATVLLKIMNYILFSIGLFFVFRKCGVKKIWAIVPGFRNYKFAMCGNMKEDGAIWFYASIIEILAQLGYGICDGIMMAVSKMSEGTASGFDSDVDLMIQVLITILDMVAFVYSVRVYLGICRLFGRRKLWTFLWVPFYGIISIIWGISKQFQPEYRISDKYKDRTESTDAEILEEGLTINIRSRTVGNHLRRQYLLRDIHLNVRPGRMVLLLGGSGSGKTTFINAVTGYEKADASIILNGMDVYRDFEKMKYEIGYVPQQDLIRYSDTVFHTIDDAAFLRLPKSCGKKERSEKVDSVLDIMGLSAVRDHMVGKQSGGQKKRISIASEFISDPSLYILDEPDSGLDGILAKDLMKRLHDISRQGKTVIVITHSPDRVIDCFDDVIVLAKDSERVGRMVFYGTVDDTRKFFGKDTMEEIIKAINRREEGGEGRADEFLARYGGLCNGQTV